VTSSIYPRDTGLSIVSVSVVNPGTGYSTTAPTVTITGGGGTGATATAFIGDGVITTIDTLVAGSGYTDGESITLSGGAAPTLTATATAVISGGIIQSVTITSGGTGYVVDDTLTITGDISGSANATIDVLTFTDDAVSSITVDTGGSDYTSAPIATLTGGDGTGATAVIVLSSSFDTDILPSDIAITSDMVKPGGGGVLRIYFSFEAAGAITNISVFNNDNFKGFLNADNNNNIESDGYYRFDLDVESGDSLNFQSPLPISINYIRAHLVQFGA